MFFLSNLTQYEGNCYFLFTIEANGIPFNVPCILKTVNKLVLSLFLSELPELTAHLKIILYENETF